MKCSGTLLTFRFVEGKYKVGSVWGDLVENLNVVVGQVEENQPAKATEGPLLHMTEVAALHGQVSQVGSVAESPRGQLLDVVASEIQLHSDLGAAEGPLWRSRTGSCSVAHGAVIS